MNHNLELLRQHSCRPAIITSRETHDLFLLEKECEQGKTLLAKTSKTLLHLEDFDPYGLYQTYRDEDAGLELPVFAVFDLKGKHQLSFEITTDSISGAAEPGSLPSYMPFEKTQVSVREINKQRIRNELALTRMSFLLGMILAFVCFIFGVTRMPGISMAGLVVGGWACGAFLTYLVSLFILNRHCPWKKLVLTAEFDGILPREVRKRAYTAKSHFDNLYLVVDQQHRWKGTLLPDPRSRALDPLLVAELKEGGHRRFFLIDQFDLTGAEQYLADEFATKMDETDALSR